MNGIASTPPPMMDLEEAARVTGGTAAGDRVSFSGVCTDSRVIAPGDLFVALKGANFDGHDYVPQAIGRGARELGHGDHPSLPATGARASVEAGRAGTRASIALGASGGMENMRSAAPITEANTGALTSPP
jgi:UDP-N-acetylmuramyl tripeptide synthase